MRVQILGGSAQGEVTGVNGSGNLEVAMDTTAHAVLSPSEVLIREEEDTTMHQYDVVKLDRGTGLTCPRRGCGNKFIVDLPKLRKQKSEAKVRGVACPYCSKVSEVPA